MLTLCLCGSGSLEWCVIFSPNLWNLTSKISNLGRSVTYEWTRAHWDLDFHYWLTDTKYERVHTNQFLCQVKHLRFNKNLQAIWFWLCWLFKSPIAYCQALVWIRSSIIMVLSKPYIGPLPPTYQSWNKMGAQGACSRNTQSIPQNTKGKKLSKRCLEHECIAFHAILSA